MLILLDPGKIQKIIRQVLPTSCIQTTINCEIKTLDIQNKISHDEQNKDDNNAAKLWDHGNDLNKKISDEEKR